GAAANIVVRLMFERAEARGDVRLARCGRRSGNMGRGAYEVVESEDAAAVELNEPGLKPLGARILQVGLDRLDVGFIIPHVAVRGLRAVRHGCRVASSWAEHDIARAGPSTEPRLRKLG